MSNQIYYLLDFYKKCSQIIMYGDDIVNKYCTFVNCELNRYFSVQDQHKMKLIYFDSNKLHQFVYDDIDDITFDGLHEDNLYQLFDKISYIDIDDL